jgi:hypothetical protein
MRLLYGEGGGGVIGWEYEISCVLAREGGQLIKPNTSFDKIIYTEWFKNMDLIEQ